MVDRKKCERIVRDGGWVQAIAVLINMQVILLNVIMLMRLVDVVQGLVWPIKVMMALLWVAWCIIMLFISCVAGNTIYKGFLEGVIFKGVKADDETTN